MMMAAGSKPKRCREVTGPTPHSVAIIARPPNKHAPEKLILDRRKQEEAREEALSQTRYQAICDLRNDWERCTDRRIQLNTVRRRVNDYMRSEQQSIDVRRERLREMLAREEQEYVYTMESQEETVLERQARMRDRAKQLKEKREAERLKIVEEKYEQQFRNQCEELRSTLSKRRQDEISAERMEQLQIKTLLSQREKEDEEMFARLYEKDRIMKAAREEAEAKKQLERNQEVLKTLQMQKAAMKARREEEERLKREEAELLREQYELRKLEEQKAAEEKRRQHEESKALLEFNKRMKMKKKAKEVQEQLAYDMQLLEKLLEESRNEAMETSQRKKEMREEDRRYREYLRQMKREEQAREKELDRLLDEEVNAMWKKRSEQWELEAEARNKLLQDVIEVRKQQISAKQIKNQQQQREAAIEKEELKRVIEENRLKELEEENKRNEKFQVHQQDLLDQINYNRAIAQDKERETEREFLLGEQAEFEYQRKLKEALDKPQIDKVHPMRKYLESLQAS